MTAAPNLTIRPATDADRPALERLAALDSKPLADRHYVVAEEADALVAAVPLGGGAAIADPFRRTAATVVLLRAHATPAETDGPRRGRLRRAARLRPRAVGQA